MSGSVPVSWVIGGLAAVGIGAIAFFGDQTMSANRELGALNAKADVLTARLDRIEAKIDRLLENSDSAALKLDDLAKSVAANATLPNGASIAGWRPVVDPSQITFPSLNGNDPGYAIFEYSPPPQ